MATSLVNLVADPFTNPATAAQPGAQSPQAPAQAQPPPTQTPGNDATTNVAEPQDQFVASNQNALAQSSAEAAGLFTVTQAAAFTPAADTLLAQANPPPINAANTPANTGVGNATTTVGATASPQAAAAAATATVNDAVAPTTAGANTAVANVTVNNAAVTGVAGANTTSANAAAAPAVAATATNVASAAAAGANATGANPATANANTTAAGIAASAVTGTVNVVTQLLTLNNALQALGLSPAEINQIDQVASLTNEFDPHAFTSMAYQLLTQSQEAAKQTAATAANATPTTAIAGGAPGATHA
jgi:hypothetical protein